jgi:hypothetical protein
MSEIWRGSTRCRLGPALKLEGSSGGVTNIGYGMGDPDIVVAWSLVMTRKTATSAPLVSVKWLILCTSNPTLGTAPFHGHGPSSPGPRLAAAGFQSKKTADVPMRSCVTCPLINVRITHDVPLLTALRGLAQPPLVLASGIWQDMQSRPHVKAERCCTVHVEGRVGQKDVGRV